MNAETGTGGKSFEPTAEDLEFIACARERFRKLDSLPRASEKLQRRVKSEMGVADRSKGEQYATRPRESEEK